ncbi:epoxyqueuosine reductase QueH [Desulfurispira natronophila]|uniref:Epoxyqueuosine reductase QueH n=1 Tax=Desulfurispira natronophila TaxID=682562 RepID=A0A7W7Y3A8_9BACT|nr:epoxyqueuosine reductase QueH [Desulfurispira natronophila]MBB5021027.1 putative adenine nucleotide alpha hydrolase (AANH) superfamily ATPase [Desulfurispira natronophila]
MTKPTLLLHTCCAPCSSAVVERLLNHYQLSLYFYNPNIHPSAEYLIRRDELLRWGRDILNIQCIIADYDSKTWFDMTRGMELEPEKGKRCTLCYQLRLEKTASVAKEQGYSFFTTTLSISPHKDSKLINTVGKTVAQKYNINFHAEDFKKNNGFQRSIEISKEYYFYRQRYCGCQFSQR